MKSASQLGVKPELGVGKGYEGCRPRATRSVARQGQAVTRGGGGTTHEMGQLEDLSAPLAAQKASVNKLQNDDGLESKIPDLQATLTAILRATEEQTRATAEQTEGATELSFQLLQNEDRVDELAAVFVKQNAELRQEVLEQNAAILAAMQEQSRATERQTRAIERQTLAIEKLAAPGRPAR